MPKMGRAVPLKVIFASSESLFSTQLPRVCILILIHNGISHIDRCLDSFLKTSLKSGSFEIVAIDNGSSDESLARLFNRYGSNEKVRVVSLGQNLGFGRGFLKALEITKPDADYFAFSNVDLYVETDWLSEILSAFITDSTTGIVSPVILKADDSGIIQVAGTYLVTRFVPVLRVSYQPNTRYEDFIFSHRDSYPVLCPNGALFVCDARAFRYIGSFDPAFYFYEEELDLGLRTWLSGGKVMIAPRSVAYHKLGHSTQRITKSGRTRRFIFHSQQNAFRTTIKCAPTQDFLQVLSLSYMWLLIYALAAAIRTNDSGLLLLHAKAIVWNFRNIRDTMILRNAHKSLGLDRLQTVVRPSMAKQLIDDLQRQSH